MLRELNGTAASLLGLFVAAILVLVILIAALRIVLGWVLPKPAMARFDHFMRAGAKLYLQLFVVALAGLILYVGWLAYHHQP